jgi:hypothetical protein
MNVPFATVDDLVAFWRPLSVAEKSRAEALLVAASAVVRSEVDRVDERIADGCLDVQIPRWVVCQMTRRVMTSGTDQPAVSQQQGSIGSVSAGFTFANPTGDLYIAKTELRMLGALRQRAATHPMYGRR